MKDILNQLYSNENFVTYLIIAIVVLVIIFLLILFLGKKDQKLEETKRLEKIKSDTFKEEQGDEIKLEIKENKPVDNISEKLPDILIPTPEPHKEEMPVIEPIVYEEVKQPNNEVLEVINIEPVLKAEEPTIKELPVMEPILKQEELPPIVLVPEEPVVPKVELKQENVLEPTHIEVTKFTPEVKEEKIDTLPNADIKLSDEVVIPEFNFDDLKSNVDEEYKEEKKDFQIEDNHFGKYEGTLSSPKIFSSVYVPEKKKENLESNDDDEFELPELKKVDVTPKEEIKSFDFDSISGETYNLK